MSETQLDALVVGAGFAGIYACYTLRELGLKFACFDNAGDVGGTWYWNRYPGAMSDTHSHLYRYSWDEDDFKTYPWTHNYLHQPDIIAYLQHVVERHDLRKHMQFNTEMVSAIFNEETNAWRVTMSTGQVLITRYLITAIGLLSVPVFPDVPGLHDFKGTMVHTSAWKDDIELKGKKVALIGNGSTGVQVFTSIAPEVESLTYFIRHPQYIVPAGRREFPIEEKEKLNANFEALWQEVRGSASAFGIEESTRPFASFTPEEREQSLEELWKAGNGFSFMLGGFSDTTTSVEANEFVADFVRGKIRDIVKDADKARILSPREHYARRPVCGINYYEQFNRDNVHVVDVKKTPMTAITGRGICTSDGVEHEFDVIIMATGFDGCEGNYVRLHIAGRDGHTIKDHWSKNISSFCGTTLSQFPNMFMVLGPQSPFANNPPAIEAQIELMASLIKRAESLRKEAGYTGVVEVTPEAEFGWARNCEEAAEATLFTKTSSWIFGENVPGKIYATRFYFPGLCKFREHIHSSIEQSWKGFTFT
jgi:cation diffusion facilitator CzcD-associated flavoprotein CzcO